MGKFVDLTGQEFGKLTVEKYIKGSRKNKSKWQCRCECGKITNVFPNDLKSGKTQSCGHRIDLTGQRFGKLTAEKLLDEHDKHNHSYWQCKCDCGKKIKVITSDLNKRTSCGCYTAQFKREAKTTHGLSKERIYNIWSSMKSRCYNKNNPCYKDYGSRGIKVSDDWKDDFEEFCVWAMANGYKDYLTIERKDVNGNYCPENCTWISFSEQAANKRNTIYLTYNGETKSAEQWGKEFEISADRLRRRISYGWSDAKALLTPPMKNQFSFKN